MRIPNLLAGAAAALLLTSSPAFAITDYFSTGPGQGTSDNLDDVWQGLFNAWGLSAAADTDNDGCSNLVESMAGTDPRNPLDCITVGNTAISANNIVISFPAELGKKYQVWQSATPKGFPGVDVAWTTVAGATKISTVNHGTDSIAFTKPGGTSKFYRVEVLDADSDNDGVSDWAENKMGTNPNLANSPANASGGTASDGDTLHSLLTLVATPGTAPVAYEKEGTPATIALQRSFGTMPLTVNLSGSNGAPNVTKSSASPADYVIKNMADVTTTSVTLPSGQGTSAPYEVAKISPVDDTTEEVSEYLKVTVGLPGVTTTATNPSALVRVADANPTNPNNRQLYVAFLGREAGATTTASGYATAQVNGDNGAATVNVTFSNLSSPLNTVYIRFGNKDAENNILQLATTQTSSTTWSIVAASVLSNDQSMLDALRTGNVFINVSTSNYSGHEIFGYFNKSTGSETFDPLRPDLVAPALPGSLSPAQTKRDIFRFLGQSTFGATTALYTEINNLLIAAGGVGGDAISGTNTSAQLLTAYTNWINKQMDTAQTPSPNYMLMVQAADNEEFVMRGLKPVVVGNDPQYAGQSYTASYDALGNLTNPYNTTGNTTFNNNHPFQSNRRREWWTMVLNCQDQLRQRMAAALQEIVVISENDTTVRDRHYGCANYWDKLAEGAFGKYRAILEHATYSPMMGQYLSHIRNRAHFFSGGVEIFPDENYAREIMQLFSIGLIQRHPDGSLVLDGDGLLLPTYDQTDITELARVMTGWCTGARHATATVMRFATQGNTMAPASARVSPQIEIQGVNFTNFSETGNEGYYQAGYIYPMKVLGRSAGVTYHDFNPYVDPEGNTSTTISKVLFAGKYAGTTSIPLVDITGMSDVASHAAADAEVQLALNALAGNPASGTYDGHPNTPVFISRLLIQRFTTSNPSAGYLYRVANAYRSTNGNLGEVLKAILLDYEARSLDVADMVAASASSRPGYAARQKEPMMHYTELLRSLKASSGAPLANLSTMTLPFSITDAMNNKPYPSSELNKFPVGTTRIRMGDLTGVIGQSPQKAPSVFNWFLPDYVSPGNLAAAGLFAPEIQIDNESNLVSRVNRVYATTAQMTLTGAFPGLDMDQFTSNAGNSAPELLTDVITLTFDSSNWNIPQTVNVRAYDDFDFEGNHTSTLLHSATSADLSYNGVVAAPTTFNINDNETSIGKLVSVVQSGGSTLVVEGGTTDTYTVVLTAAPAAGQTVTVTPSVRSPFYTTAAPAVATDATVSPASVTFDGSNWQTPQTFTVTANDDSVVNSYLVGGSPLNQRAVMIRNDITSGDADYNGMLVSDIVSTVIDNDGTTRLIVAETSVGGTAGGNGISIVTEGSTTDTFTVGLGQGSAPIANVSVAMTYDSTRMTLSGTGVTVSPPGTATLVFTPANFTSPVTITITAVDDSTYQGLQFKPITFATTSTDPPYNGLPAPTLQVRVNDNDSDTVNDFTMIAYGGINNIRAVEGGMTSAYLVVLNKAPTGDVTLAWTGNSGDVAGIGSPVFTTTNWFVPQIVTVSGNNDIFPETTHISRVNYDTSGGGYSLARRSFDVTIGDDDLNVTAGVTIAQSAGTTGVNEAGATTDTFDVSLRGTPNSNVTVTLTASPAGQVTVSPSVLTFTPGNANTVQTVTVTAIDDSVIEGAHTAAITIAPTSTDAKYNNFTVADVVANITDNDTGSAIVMTHTGGSTTVIEGGTTDTISIALSGSAPASDVVVNLTPNSQVSYSPTSLTFTSGNYTSLQTVTVTATNDTAPEQVLTQNILATTDGAQPVGYTNLTASLPATVLDNDDMNNGGVITPGNAYVQQGGQCRVMEGGPADTVEMYLRRAPTTDVTFVPVFNFNNGNTVTSIPNNQVTLSVPSLTFTPNNWNIPQSFTVTAVDDNIPEGFQVMNVNFVAIPAGNYTASDNAAFSVTIGDNEAGRPAIVIGGTTSGTVTENSAPTNITYSVVLTTPPNAGATVRITPSAILQNASNVNLANTSQLTFTPANVNFTNANYSVPQTIVVSATNDALAEATQTLTVLNTASVLTGGTDLNYNGMTAADVIVTVNDDDTAANRYAITETGGSTVVAEDGAGDTFTVAFVGAVAPTANVTSTLTRAGSRFQFVVGGVPANSQTLTFTPVNYTTPQTVNIVAAPNTLDEGLTTDAVNISTSGPAGYTGLTGTFPVRILDNDDQTTKAIQIIQNNANTRVVEGGMTDTFEVYLRRQPTGTVTLTPTFSAPGQVTFSPATPTFNANNWAIPQVVTVTAVNDGLFETPATNTTSVIFNASATGGYLPTDAAASFNVTVGDGTTGAAGGVVVSTPVASSITEGGSTTYTITLASPPAAGATVRVTPSTMFLLNATSTGQVTFSPTSVDFTNATTGLTAYNRLATITVTAVDDAIVEQPQALTITNAVSISAGTDAHYNGTVAGDVKLTVNDNEAGRLVITETGTPLVVGGATAVMEDIAGTANVSVALVGTAPTAGSPVTVTVARSTNGDIQFVLADGSVTGNNQTLTFTDTNYNVPQYITISAVGDANVEGIETDTLTFSTSSTAPAPYASISNVIPVRVIDNEDLVRALISVYQTGGVTKVVEGGAPDSYSVVLRRAPTADVVVTPSFNPSQITLSTGALTFTAANWNVPQTVTVTAVDDSDIENAHTSTINYTASGTGGYLLTDTASIPVLIGDNDALGAALVTITESGGSTILAESPTVGVNTTDTYTVVLGAQPTANVTITPQAYNPLTGVSGTNVVTFSAPLVFTPVNWNTPQTVTVTLAHPDTSINSARAVFIGHKISSSDLNYATFNVPSITAILSDADETTVGLFVQQSGGGTNMYEGATAPNNSDTVYVMLRKKPTTGTVVVTPTLNTAGQVTFSPTTLSFTTTNWNVPQVLTMTAVNDAVTEGNPQAYTLTCTPSAVGGYAVTNVGTLANINIYDAATSKIIIGTPNGNTVTEGSTVAYTVALGSAPSAPVTISIATQKHARPNGYLSMQGNYFANDVPGSSNRLDKMLLNWTELTNTYTAAYLAAKGATTETTGNAPGFHLAATKAVVDQLDLWWCGGRMKALWPDGTPATTPPSNQRQPIIDAVLNAYSTTRFSNDATNFPIEARDRCRWAAYLVSISPAGITSH